MDPLSGLDSVLHEAAAAHTGQDARDAVERLLDSMPADKSRCVPLSRLRAGRWFRVYQLPDGPFRARFVRVGIHEGERVRCLQRLPGGTMVLQKRRQQIAVGHQLARQILVIALDDEDT